jgi:hypothetical protein
LTATDFLSPDNRERTLDSCGFMPALASRIVGMGGNETPGDPAYAFHTEYVPCGTGTAVFTLRPVDLSATRGNLTVRIGAISTAPGAVARTVKMAMIPLEEFAATGEMQLSVKTKNGVLYAVIGLIYGSTDATADDIHILLEVTPNEDAVAEEEVKASYSTFGHEVTRPTSQLAAHGPATLAAPVSQVCTRGQIEDAAYARAAASLGLGGEGGLHAWRLAYAYRVLESYGVIQSGARGLGYMIEPDSLPARLAADGCGIIAAAHAGEVQGKKRLTSLDDLRYTHVGSHERLHEDVAVRTMDDWTIPEDFGDFDFCWSTGAIELLASKHDAIQFIKGSLRPLKIGGLAVHVLPFDAATSVQAYGEGGPFFTRGDIERLAFDIVSFGHEIAQVKFGTDEDRAMGAIGLVLRKGESTFF